MPDYKTLPQPGSITVEEALRAGKRDITYKSRLILAIGVVLGLLLHICGLSIWFLPALIVAGIVSAFLYTIWITPQWRIWAYAGVADIHQFQRCAELELLLPKQSPLLVTGIMSSAQRATLVQLQQRFEEDPPFIDDPDVDQVTNIYPSLLSMHTSGKPEVMISRKGIETREFGFYPWSEIWNEHVAIKSFASRRGFGYSLGSQTSSTAEYFCFFCPDVQVEIPLSSLDISAGELDQILYIHRGRFNEDVAGKSSSIPLKRNESGQ